MINILVYTLFVSVQTVKKSVKIKEVDGKNLIEASANGINKLAVENYNLEIIYLKNTLFSNFHAYICISVPVSHMTYCVKLSQELHIQGNQCVYSSCILIPSWCDIILIYQVNSDMCLID